MATLGYVMLYVDDPTASATFYSFLLGRHPVESTPSFAMLPLSDGVMLGLWSKDTVAPAATPPGGGEVAFKVADAATLQATYEDWQERGVRIAQKPTAMDFGHTFVALDRDGHRLRVFAEAAVQ
jgi:catechol 2,3-dioxygenase-like lactoylglutathione lyase family enzyme